MMKKIGKVFGLLILMLMFGVAGAGIYDWGMVRWGPPVIQISEKHVPQLATGVVSKADLDDRIQCLQN